MVEISLNLCDLCGRQSHGSVIEMVKEERLDPWKKYRVCETCFKDIEIIIKDKMTGAHSYALWQSDSLNAGAF